MHPTSSAIPSNVSFPNASVLCDFPAANGTLLPKTGHIAFTASAPIYWKRFLYRIKKPSAISAKNYGHKAAQNKTPSLGRRKRPS